MRRFVETVFLLVCGILFWWLFFLPYAHVAATETKAPPQEVVGPVRFTFHWPVERFQATVTGYNSVRAQTDSTPCIAANGENICRLLREGSPTCAANGFPFGTILDIQHLGTCVVRDRMGNRFGKGTVDWYFGGASEIQTARRFGKQTLTVTVFD